MFLPSEAEDLLSFVTLGVLFLWDVNVIGSDSRRMFLYSHDEMVDVVGEPVSRGSNKQVIPVTINNVYLRFVSGTP